MVRTKWHKNPQVLAFLSLRACRQSCQTSALWHAQQRCGACRNPCRDSLETSMDSLETSIQWAVQHLLAREAGVCCWSLVCVPTAKKMSDLPSTLSQKGNQDGHAKVSSHVTSAKEGQHTTARVEASALGRAARRNTTCRCEDDANVCLYLLCPARLSGFGASAARGQMAGCEAACLPTGHALTCPLQGTTLEVTAFCMLCASCKVAKLREVGWRNQLAAGRINIALASSSCARSMTHIYSLSAAMHLSSEPPKPLAVIAIPCTHQTSRSNNRNAVLQTSR